LLPFFLPLGECPLDPGGYFIVEGEERVIFSIYPSRFLSGFHYFEMNQIKIVNIIFELKD